MPDRSEMEVRVRARARHTKGFDVPEDPWVGDVHYMPGTRYTYIYIGNGEWATIKTNMPLDQWASLTPKLDLVVVDTDKLRYASEFYKPMKKDEG